MAYCLQNAFVLRDHQLVKEDLWLEDKKIVQQSKAKSIKYLDYRNKIIAPGFIDLQLNGAFGIDFTTQPEKIRDVAMQLPLTGVTAFLATLISSPQYHYKKVLPEIIHAKKFIPAQAAQWLGIHLEGPFLNPQKAGAHPPTCIFPSEKAPISFHDLKNTYGSFDEVRLITLAPEIAGMREVIEQLQQQKINIAAGHTLATYEEANESFKIGVTLATHLFNAMHPLNQREPGLIGAALKPRQGTYYSLIADGIHVHPALVEMAWKTNPEGCILITDGIAPLGLKQTHGKEQHFHLGFSSIHSTDYAFQLVDKPVLAGGITPMNVCIKRFLEMTKCSLVDGIEAATLKPARYLGIDHLKGTLKCGADADLVILDDELGVMDVFIQGQLLET